MQKCTMNEVGVDFFSTRPYLYNFEYIEFVMKILFVNGEMNLNSKVSEYPVCRMANI